MKRALPVLIVLIISLTCRYSLNGQNALFYSYGQQDPQFTQYMFNPVCFNPADAGTNNAWVSTLAIRNQWVNLPGAPVSQSFTSHVPVYKISSGAGITILNDIAGLQRNTGASLIYAYHKQLRTALLSFGLSGGMVQQSLDGNKIVTPTGIYGDVVDHNDPNLPVSLTSVITPDAAAGVWYTGENLSAGVSGTHILTPFISGGKNAAAEVQYNPNGYVFVAYKIEIGDKLGITPNVLYKTDLIESVVDINTILTYNNNILAGLSYRGFVNNQRDAVALVAGLNINDKWQISYSYDITTSALNAVSAGSHEVVLRYSVPMARPRAGKMINNPRFLYH